MMSGHLKNIRIGKELMKTSRTELGIALVDRHGEHPLAGCGKPEPSPRRPRSRLRETRRSRTKRTRSLASTRKARPDTVRRSH
jgi:hypothetical protein